MNKIKQELLQLLTALDYNGDKNEFINSFLLTSYQQTIINLVSTLSSEDVQKFEREIAEEKYSLEVGIKNYFTQEQMQQTFKEVVTKNVQEAIEAVIPSLSEEQLTKVDSLVNSYAAQSSTL